MGEMITAVDLEGKDLNAVVADWLAANESRWKAWLN
jgi:glycine betaine/proline transport system substrate-binding protein